jgi:pimeloyl-ACP methyl ester carboxylesterase
MQYLRWDKANIIGLSMGGAIAAAFTDQFPHLVDEGVGLIASAGLMEVRCLVISFQLICSFCRAQLQSSEISRTAKFMSSPLVQTLAASRPVRVCIIFISLILLVD